MTSLWMPFSARLVRLVQEELFFFEFVSVSVDVLSVWKGGSMVRVPVRVRVNEDGDQGEDEGMDQGRLLCISLDLRSFHLTSAPGPAGSFAC